MAPPIFWVGTFIAIIAAFGAVSFTVNFRTAEVEKVLGVMLEREDGVEVIAYVNQESQTARALHLGQTTVVRTINAPISSYPAVVCQFSQSDGMPSELRVRAVIAPFSECKTREGGTPIVSAVEMHFVQDQNALPVRAKILRVRE